ncbi:hypothetical protein HanPI659440_Chr14g0547441 [Helianthus annuus]|nr:hypothetical protein HanPI659440_Chr14g0547441 [Helianthus annuus]
MILEWSHSSCCETYSSSRGKNRLLLKSSFFKCGHNPKSEGKAPEKWLPSKESSFRSCKANTPLGMDPVNELRERSNVRIRVKVQIPEAKSGLPEKLLLERLRWFRVVQ